MRLKLYTVYGRLKTGDAFKRFLMCGVEVQEDLVGVIGLFGFFELFQQGCETVDCPEMRGIERKGLAQISERKTVFAQAKEGARAAVPAIPARPATRYALPPLAPETRESNWLTQVAAWDRFQVKVC